MSKQTVDVTRTVAGRTFSASLATDSHGRVGIKDALAFELSIAAEIAAGGPVSGETFSWLRRAGLGMTARELAELLGVSNVTISRWENDARAVDRASWLVVASLVSDLAEGRTDTRERLERLRDEAA
jgi:DNA-binding transcriptional regulator YiaG